MSRKVKIVSGILLMLYTARASYFEFEKVYEDEYKSCKSNALCIDGMDKILYKFFFELKPFQSEEAYLCFEYNKIYFSRNKFFKDLIDLDFINGINFPIKYKHELENIDKCYQIPTISSFISQNYINIFNKFRLSEKGLQLFHDFYNFIAKYNLLANNYYPDFINCVNNLHEKLIISNQQQLKIWDEESFDYMRKVKDYYAIYLKTFREIDLSYGSLVCGYNMLYLEWSMLEPIQKYYIIHGYEHDQSELNKKKVIISSLTTKKRKLDKLKNRLVEEYHKYKNIASVSIEGEILESLLLFMYNFNYLLASYKNFLNFLNMSKNFLVRSRYPESTDFLEKLNNFYNWICKSKNEVFKDENYIIIYEIACKRIVISSESCPNIFKAFFKTKSEELKNFSKLSISSIISFLSKDIKISTKAAEDILSQFKSGIFDFNKFSQNRIKYYSTMSYYYAIDLDSHISATNKIIEAFEKSLISLRKGNNNKIYYTLYSNLENLLTKMSELVELNTISTCKFNLVMDEIEVLSNN
ncbi:hypothetical protein H312_00120 [Anncaliia algerae PRA339]|uniref:Uncharacterized protein n=1 Tax=Anncaliia algerae PRA339 TaxID=1288291 RepID=A0A059F5S2_9MICR|nr:hypothetical protein H312_00120 [Anncaliia algerae PRA339]